MLWDYCLRSSYVSVMDLTAVLTESQPITSFSRTKDTHDTHTVMPLCSPGALVLCFVKRLSHNDKSAFEVNCTKLYLILFQCTAVRQAWIESYQCTGLKYTIGALNDSVGYRGAY